jgi:hypothetical protein
VREFLGDRYVVHTSNPNQQALHMLVRRTLSSRAKSLPYDGAATELLRSDIPFYPWGKIAAKDVNKHKFNRTPLVLDFQLKPGKILRIINVHTKSKYSKLKTPAQWKKREPAAINDALLSRQKLSAEVLRLRQFAAGSKGMNDPVTRATVVLGDFNDGPFAELMEREFLIHNIIDEMVGTFVEPDSYFKHAMTAEQIAKATTVSFPDPLEGGKIVNELIDHMLLSPVIWRDQKPVKLKPGSCKVELAAYNAFDSSDKKRKRGDRPSDHKPVSLVLEY